jgi:hypothetical protein
MSDNYKRTINGADNHRNSDNINTTLVHKMVKMKDEEKHRFQYMKGE